MKSKGFILALVAALAFFAGSATAQTCIDRDSMLKAAEESGVSIYPDQMASAAGDGASVTAATIQGYEQVPPANIAKGTDVGFIHLDAPGSGIPAGFYTLRASANPDDVRVGRFEASVDLVDGGGRVVGTLPAIAEASTLEVPSVLPFERTAVETSITSGNTEQQRTIIIIIRCPNGLVIIIVIHW